MFENGASGIQLLRSALEQRQASIEQIVAFQSQQLRKLVRHCYERVSYYRRVFDNAGITPDDIRGVQDLARIPMTARSDIQSLPIDEIVAAGVDPDSLTTHRTSGSSGIPLRVRRARAERYLHAFQEWRMYRSLGNRFWDRRASIGFQRRRPDSKRKKRFYRRLGFYAMESIDILLPAREILDRLGEIRPDILIGPPSMAAWLAGELTTRDRDRISPRLVVTWGETCTPEMRRQIEDGFRTRLVDFYVSHEFRAIAIQCPHTGYYHVFDRTVLVEVLKDGRPAAPGEQGELVGTALFSFAMPFLRYRQADLVTVGPSPCPCGMVCRTLASVDGRVLDRVTLPDGSSIHPYSIFTPVVQEAEWIRRYQFWQEEPDRLRVRLEPVGNATDSRVKAVRDAIAAKLGDSVRLEVEIVDRIPLSPTGKFYPYVSLERWKSWEKSDSLS